MPFTIQLQGKSNAVTFVVDYGPHEGLRSRKNFGRNLSDLIGRVSNKDQLLVVLDANARAGQREAGGRADSTVLGALGRDVLSNNGERLLTFATESELAIVDTFF